MEDLKRIIEELLRENAELKKALKAANDRIAELERRLGLNSSNSSKPPSTDGFKRPPRSLREKSGKKPGGQLGHEGSTLQPVRNPDAIELHKAVSVCTNCGESLVDIPGTEERGQVFEVIIERRVTEHRAFVKKCKCGHRNSPMPKDIKAPVQYGVQAKAIASYLSTAQLLPRARTAELFSELFKIPISEATLVEIDRECSEKLTEFDIAILEAVKKALIKHADETGMKIGKKLAWLHILSNDIWTHYRVSPKRGALLSGIVGHLIHDHWKSYFTLEEVLHALCNAHHLRELKSVIEHDQEPWAQEMIDLLVKASRLEKPTPTEQQDISDKYDQIIKSGLKLHAELTEYKPGTRKKRPSLNLLNRLKDFKAETLRFLYVDGVPFTNNNAEQGLRMVKLKQKISGCFRTAEGARDFARNRSFVATARKQRKSVYKETVKIFDGSFNVGDYVDGWQRTNATAPP